MNAELNISEEVSDSCVETARILLTYRDPDHEQLGRRYCDLTTRRSDWKGRPEISEWKFEMLDSAGMNSMAATEALEARLIVIATNCGEELPDSLKTWVESWSSQRTDEMKKVKGKRQKEGEETSNIETLVVTLSECAGYSEGHWPDYAFLERQTQKCGMQLIVYATGLPPENGSSLCLREARRITREGFAAIEDFSASVAFI